MRPHSRGGFSLVELLVVIAMVLLLVALILPAIQKVREAANRMLCGSYLQQITVAAHHYHTDFGRLPPGYLGPSLANNTNLPALYSEGQWIGHLPVLLPYLEQDNIAKEIHASFDPAAVSVAKWWWSNSSTGPGQANVPNYRAAMRSLKVFRCPSADSFAVPIGDPSPAGGGTIVGLHVFNSQSMGAFTTGWKDEYGTANQFRPLGRTNYLGVAGCGSGTHAFYSKYEGVYTNRSANSLGQISSQDGTSNTLLYGETCGSQWGGSPPDSVDICWMAGGALGTYLGLQRGRTASTIAFSSFHLAGVQFAFADGSVRALRFGETANQHDSPLLSDWLLLQQLAGRADGGPADASRLVD